MWPLMVPPLLQRLSSGLAGQVGPSWPVQTRRGGGGWGTRAERNIPQAPLQTGCVEAGVSGRGDHPGSGEVCVALNLASGTRGLR